MAYTFDMPALDLIVKPEVGDHALTQDAGYWIFSDNNMWIMFKDLDRWLVFVNISIIQY